MSPNVSATYKIQNQTQLQNLNQASKKARGKAGRLIEIRSALPLSRTHSGWYLRPARTSSSLHLGEFHPGGSSWPRPASYGRTSELVQVPGRTQSKRWARKELPSWWRRFCREAKRLRALEGICEILQNARELGSFPLGRCSWLCCG